MGDLRHTTKTRGTKVLLSMVLLLFLMDAASANRRRGRSRQCPNVPRFRVNDVEPIAVAGGQVTLVALLTSNCPFCIEQSRKMQEMYTSLQANGTSVHMMIVNGGPRPQPGEVGTFEAIVSFPVYHDDDERTIWRSVFRGSKDDMFVVNTCGQIAYRIPFPYSYMGYNYARRALNRALQGQPCSNCHSSNLQNRMMGDAPSIGFGSRQRPGHMRRFGNWGHADRMNNGRNPRGRSSRPSWRSNIQNRSRCPRSDLLCRELRHARRRYNRYRQQHGIQLRPGMREEQVLDIFERSQGGRSAGPVF